MAYLQICGGKYPCNERFMRKALSHLRAVDELSREGMIGKITFTLIEEKLAEKKEKLSEPTVWELAAMRFILHEKVTFKGGAGFPTYVHRWRLNTRPNKGLKDFEEAVRKYYEYKNMAKGVPPSDGGGEAGGGEGNEGVQVHIL